MRLNPGKPFHSSLMNVVKKDFENILNGYEYHKFNYPVISNLTGKCYLDSKDIPKMLSEQLIKPVQWIKSIQFIADNGVNKIIEMKPQTILRNLMMTNKFGIDVYSDDDRRDKEYIEEIVFRMSNPFRVQTENKIKLIRRCVASAVSVQNNNFSDESYKKEVCDIYEQLMKLQNGIEVDKVDPTYEDMKDSVYSLVKILNGKKISQKERIDIVKDILYDTGLYELFPEFMSLAG